jgi:prepilin-type N-terminal cleavage/methylation domain-containing protein
MMRRRRDDRGMTLVETLVAMILLTVVVGLATGSLIVALDKQSNVRQSTEDTTSTQNAVELMSRVVRQGVYPTGSSTTSSIVQSGSSPTQLIVDSRLSSTASANQNQMTSTITQYTFYVSGTTMFWKQGTVTCNGATCTVGTQTTPKVLIRGVRTTTAACPANTAYTDGPFHYVTLDATGAVVSPAWGTPTAAQLNSIYYVTVNLFTEVATGPHAPACTSLADYVQLRNKS